MRKFRPLLALLLILATLWMIRDADVGNRLPSPSLPSSSQQGPARGPAETAPTIVAGRTAATSTIIDGLPPEAADTLALIARGGPFPHRQDGATFGNRERQLPPRERGYYREYTVATPGLGHRGPRRIVTGGKPAREYWYTDDHYGSFRRFEVSP